MKKVNKKNYYDYNYKSQTASNNQWQLRQLVA